MGMETTQMHWLFATVNTLHKTNLN